MRCQFNGLSASVTKKFQTYMMIYSPAYEKEVAINRQILEAAVKYQSMP